MTAGGFIYGAFLLALTLTKAALTALAVIYPSYKTYKALESRSLQASQSMLLYWCITAFVASLKEGVDAIFGQYSNFFVWKLAVLALKAAPLIIGPERLYALIIKPLYDSQHENVDAVVEEAHKVKAIAQEAVPAVKSGDVDVVKEKASEVLGLLNSDVVHNLQDGAAQVTEFAQHKAEEFGIAWNRQGAMGVLDTIVAQFEIVRDAVVGFTEERWEQHGPMVKKHSSFVLSKGTDLYSTHAPVLKSKAIDTYTSTIAPKLQPAVDAVKTQYSSKLVPFVTARKDQAQQLWATHGGPVRTFYANQWTPLYTNTIKPTYTDSVRPFIVHSFLPAVWETLLAMKERLMDVLSPPTEEMKTQRATHKRRRNEAREARANASWKKRGHAVKNKWAGAWKEMEQVAEEKETTQGESPIVESAAAPAATLSNRKSHEVRDSSIPSASAPITEAHPIAPLPHKDDALVSEKPIDVEFSKLDADAPVFKPTLLDSTDVAIHDSLANGDKLHLSVQDKQGRVEGEKEGHYSSEARSVAEPIQ